MEIVCNENESCLVYNFYRRKINKENCFSVDGWDGVRNISMEIRLFEEGLDFLRDVQIFFNANLNF